jgi:protein ImuA
MSPQLLNQLAARIREIEANARSLAPTSVPLGIPALEDVFPDKCLPAGSLVELLSTAEGAGAWTLALLMAKQACGEQKILVIADGQCCFYPPAAFRLGLDLHRTLVLRTKRREDALAALVQSLRCAAVGAVLGSLDRLTSAEYRSLQLAAETGGGIGFLLRPAAARRAPSFAAVRLLVAPKRGRESFPQRRRHARAIGEETAPDSFFRRRIQIEVVRMRGRKASQSFVLEIDDETGHVYLPAPVAAPATVAASARPPQKAGDDCPDLPVNFRGSQGRIVL